MKVLTTNGQLESISASSDLLIADRPLTPASAVPLIGRGRSYLKTANWVQYQTVYRTNPWLWAVVNLIARSSSRMPLVVSLPSDQGSGLRDVVQPGSNTEAARLAKALRSPGRGVSWQAQQYGTTVDRLVQGNALWEIEREGASIDGFRRIPWTKVTTGERAGETVYLDHTRDPDGILKPRLLLMEQVIHFGYWADSENAVNVAAISTLHSTLALFDAVYRHLVNYFAHSTRPSGHYEVDPATSEAAVKRMMATIRVAYAGPDNAGRPTVSSGKYTPSTATNDEAQVVELAKQSREEIVAAYGVAPPLVGILDRAIMSNVKELREHTIRDTTGPHLELMGGDIQAQAVDTSSRLELDGVLVEFDFMRQLRPSPEAAAAMIPNRLRTETPNELRVEMGRPRLDDPRADQLWFPNGADGDESTLAGEALVAVGDPEAIAAVAQKIYLAVVNEVITRDEARALLREMGMELGEFQPNDGGVSQ
ncbi:MAG: phage portal protein [Actinomycetota bacterium]